MDMDKNTKVDRLIKDLKAMAGQVQGYLDSLDSNESRDPKFLTALGAFQQEITAAFQMFNLSLQLEDAKSKYNYVDPRAMEVAKDIANGKRDPSGQPITVSK